MMLEAVAHNHANRDNRKVPNLSYNLRAGGAEKVWISFESNYHWIQIINLLFTLECRLKTDLNNSSVRYSFQS